MHRHVRENIVFILISLAAFISEPAIVQAQESPYNPVNFTEPLSLSRGKIFPVSPGSLYLDEEDRCTLLIEEWGWSSCQGIDAMIFGLAPGIDNIMVETPVSDGYVKFDDWDDGDRQKEIEAIWSDYAEGARQQGAALGQRIEPVRWYVYPTLNKEKSYLYYAILLDWDGEMVINAKASLFDRQGYVPISVTPVSTNLSETELQELVEVSLSAYRANSQQSYFDFQDGDKVAAVGAMGVLASLVGVKYGKAAAGGILALALVFLKKAWFVLLIPLVFLKNLIFGKKEKAE
jgi:uncharacterized membrane-anchored protein